MTTLIQKAVDTYNYIFTDLADPRVNDFFLVSSPIPIVILISLYLYFTTSFGPRYMKDRKPYDLKNVVLVYNVVLVLMSTYLAYEGGQYILSDQFKFTCTTVDYSDNPIALRVANAAWWYFFSKVIEFLDTIFFVLRKKNNQISFLHVYHHSIMAFTMWIGVKYFAGGHGALMAALNAFVHIIMYTYYLIAGLGPQYQKYIWWKKHVTTLQLGQFVIIFIHNLIPLFSDCAFPKILNIILISNATIFLNLFGKFFYASYIKGKREKPNGVVKNGTSNGHSKDQKSFKNGKVERLITNGKHKDE